MTKRTLKVHYVVLEFLTYNSNEVINSEIIFHNWINKLFWEENKVPWTLFVAIMVAGSATYKQSETAWHCVVLWGQFVYLVCLVNKDLSPQNIHCAPLIL